MSAATLLDRLDGVRATGTDRWAARCPAHEDRAPSLSIREADDGTVLLHCFAGCEVDSILAAVGLEFADLFPPADPAVHVRHPSSSRLPATDALQAIDHEAHVVAIIAADVHQHVEIDLDTWRRLALAVQRIGEARARIAPARVKVTE